MALGVSKIGGIMQIRDEGLEEIREELRKQREEIKLKTRVMPPGRADGTTAGGSVCAASFGTSIVGQQMSLNNYLQDKSQGVETPRRNVLATEKQVKLAKDIGVTLDKSCSKHDASSLISAGMQRKVKRESLRRRGKLCR